MSTSKRPFGRRLWLTLSSVKTGIILLIIIGLAAAAGTFILQRPLTEAAKLEQAYSPDTLLWLDRLGLTDVYHSWWFLTLLGLMSVSIVLASLDRFPQTWRFFSRPYRWPEAPFRATLPLRAEIPIDAPEAAIEGARSAFRRAGLRPVRSDREEGSALFAERHRYARLAPYLIHVSLLLIMAGGIVDGVVGWGGFAALVPGERISQVELRGQEGVFHPLPFELRCDATGQENYPDGTPKRWWSKLTVLENGREVLHKEIAVNEPLVYGGIRGFQASFGPTGEVESVTLTATPRQEGEQQTLELRRNQPAELPGGTRVSLARFIPDFVVQDNQIYMRSRNPVNPAVQLSVLPPDAQQASTVWVFARFPEFSHQTALPWEFRFAGLEMQNFTGIQFSYEPGQGLVWAGCVLLALSLALAFQFVHVRYWAMPTVNREGRLVLWVGASPAKDREDKQEEFQALVETLKQELKTQTRKDEAALAAPRSA